MKMSKSIYEDYEEALELLNNGCDGPQALDTYKIALEQAQKQEKLLELYIDLNNIYEELYTMELSTLINLNSNFYKFEIAKLKNQIRRLEK